LTLISVPIGVFYHIMTLRNAQRTREQSLKAQELQVFLQIYNRMGVNLSKAYFTILGWEWDGFDDFMDKYGEIKNPEVWTSNASLLHNFYQPIGLLVRQKMIDPKLVEVTRSGFSKDLGEDGSSNTRIQGQIPFRQEEAIEYLYNVLKPLRDRRVETILSHNP